MEPIISKLQEGVKYPRFERDATTIINDLVEHITKERGVYSSSIEPNPNEHKVWFNTNNNTLNIYENGKWNTISGQGGGSNIPSNLSGITSINMNSGSINGVQTLNVNSGGHINYAGKTLITNTGSDGGVMLLMPYGGNIGLSTKTIKISDTTISGSTINAGRINIVSGEHSCMIYQLGSYLTFSKPLADMTLSHSIDLNYGSIAGLTSIKTLSYTGLSIEPYDTTGTGTPIIINGRAAGLSLGANSTAPFTLDGISSLNWKNGSSNGYMMTFNTNNNTLKSNFDNFNIANGNITLTSGMISGNANINLTLSGTISGGTISGGTISGGNIKDAIINGGAINNADITSPTIKNVTISGGNINGVTLGNINISSGTISEGGTLNYGSLILLTYAGTVTNPVLIPNGGIIGNANKTVNVAGISIVGSAINNATINNGKFAGSMDISTGGNITYANNKVLLTYTGSVGNPILMPNGGDIGISTSKFNICGVALTGGDFQKLKNLQ